MGFAKVRGPLTTRIGRHVKFRRPQDVARRIGDGVQRGKIVGEIWENQAINLSKPHKHHRTNCWGDYSFFAQLIEWNDEGSAPWYQVRLGYWRRRCGENTWEMAGQTTATARWGVIKRLCKKTLDMNSWQGEKPEFSKNR